MDILSHLLIGLILASLLRCNRKKTFLIMLFSIIPDLFQIPLYLYVGYENARFLWIPLSVDWIGFRLVHPILSLLWEIPHSFFFAMLVGSLVVFVFKLPKEVFLAYVLHLVIDIFTHSGEWALKPFYPFSYVINGFTDVWAWPLYAIIISWILLSLILIGLKIYFPPNKN